MEVSGKLTPQPLLFLGRSPSYPLDRGLEGPQKRSGRCGPENLLHGYGTNNIKHTTKVNDTLKRNTETAAKKDRIKMSYEAN
jgi:hypothetical protein